MDYRSKLTELNVLRNSYSITLEERNKRKEEIENQLDVVSKGQLFVQEVAQNVQSQLSSTIDNIINLGLSSCLPEYTFHMEYVPSRGKTEVQFNVMKDGKLIDPMSQCGGGLVDILCFCLRIAVYSISSINNVIVLDEPFKYVSKSLRPLVADLMTTLSEKLDLQFLYVTHIEELSECANKQIIFKKIDGVSCLQN